MPLSVMFFGDSICNGQGTALHRGWVARISSEVPEGWIVVNAARNGDTTRLALERMPYEVQAHMPEILVVQFGMNDANEWKSDRGLPRVSWPAYKANLSEIVMRGKRFGAKKVILLTNHLPDGRKQRTLFPSTVQHYNEALRQVAQNRCMLVDIESYTHLDDMTIEDGVHLSERGHDLYYKTVEPIIMECIGEVEP